MQKSKINNKTVLTVLLGNTFEFYCFILFVVLTPYIASQFFVNMDRKFAFIVSYGISMCGYISRPFGAMILGAISDVYSRKKALSISLLATGAITSLIGVIPSLNLSGSAPIIILILLRFLQGFLVSGEEGGAAVYLSEVITKKRSCFIGSLVLSSVFLGILLGRFSCNILDHTLGEQQMYAFGWRIPFLIGFPIAIIINKFRSVVPEVGWQEHSSKLSIFDMSPIKQLFSDHKAKVFHLIISCAAYSAITCMMMVYIPNLCRTNFSPVVFTVGIGFMMLLLPIFGLICDKVTPRKVLRLGLLSATILVVPSVWVATSSDSLLLSIVGLAVLYINTTLIASPIFAYLVQMFPKGNRCTGVSFVFNTSVCIFSGAFPFVCSIISGYNPSPLVPAYLVFFLAIISYSALLLVGKIPHARNGNKKGLVLFNQAS